LKKRLATYEQDNWELDDAEPIAAEHPDTFYMPSLEERNALKPGQLVKLIFRILTVDEAGEEKLCVERMWVVVTGREGKFYTGKLDNQPYCTHDMNPGMPLYFEARHVINIDEDTLINLDEYYKEENEVPSSAETPVKRRKKYDPRYAALLQGASRRQRE